MRRDAKADLDLCEAATPGPWSVDDGGGLGYGVFSDADLNPICMMGDDGANNTRATSPGDAAFIAESREALPYWIERAGEDEKALALIMEECAAACQACRMDNGICVSENCAFTVIANKVRERLGDDIDRILKQMEMEADG